MGRIIQGKIGVPFPCQPLVTGQTVQYDDEKDDGYWEMGISRKFVALTLGQYSGTVDIELNLKTHALSNNCVFDRRTGLMWARYIPDGDIGPDGDGLLYYKEGADAENIFRFKAQAKSAKLGGHNDWRIPNLNELLGICDYTCVIPFDPTYFGSILVGSYWTSTTVVGVATDAWVVRGATKGSTYWATKATAKNYCRLVRGPK